MAETLLLSSGVVLLLLGAYALWGMAAGDPSAVFGLFTAFWLAVQSLQLYQAYQLGDAGLAMHPLFREGEAQPTLSANAPPGAPPSRGDGRVCAAAALVVALAVSNVPLR